MQKHLTLNLNGLLSAQRVKEGIGLLKVQSLPYLQTLLSKAHYHFTKPKDSESLSAYLFHQEKPPASAITRIVALTKLSEEAEQQFWISIDPAHLIPDRDSLVLIPAEDIGITSAESKALLKSFNEHFAEDGIELVYGSASQWFLSISQTVDLSTTPIHQVAYQSVNDFYPSGPAGNYWRQLMNEAQMLFYNHEVNHQRRLNNLPEINSIWVWGEGSLSPSQINHRPDAAMFSDYTYSQGLAKLCHAKTKNNVQTFQQWFEQSEKINHSLIELSAHSLTGISLENMTIEQWVALLKQCELDWFMPIFQSLKNKELDSVLLVLGANKHYLLTPKSLNRFWRWKKPWMALTN